MTYCMLRGMEVFDVKSIFVEAIRDSFGSFVRPILFVGF